MDNKKKNNKMWTMFNSPLAIIILFILLFIGYKNIYIGLGMVLFIAILFVAYLEHEVNNTCAI